MDEIRKGQIALLYLKNNVREEGVRLTPNMKRQIGNTAKAIGISVEEAMEFAEIMVRELVEETFAKPKNGKDEIGSEKCWEGIARKEESRKK